MNSREDRLKIDQAFFDLLAGSYARLTRNAIVSGDTSPT